MQFTHLLGLITLLFAISSYAQVVQVTDDNLDTLIKSSDEWLLDFYADWCGYCKKFAPKYEAAERILASNAQTSHVRVGKVNVDTAPSLAARFFVSRLPTVVHIKEHEVRVIPPAQTSNLASLIVNEEWREIEPVKGLTSPFSVIGSLVGTTGRLVKFMTKLSPVTIVVGMFGLLALVVVLPMYLPAPPEDDSEETVSGSNAAGASSASTQEEKKSKEQKKKD